MESVTTGITSCMTLVTTMLDAIIDNPVLVVIFASGFIGIACKVLGKIVRTSKSTS